MKNESLNGERSASAFIESKLNSLDSMEHSFHSLYQMMFSERENVFFERSVGWRLQKTTYGESFDSIEHRARTLQGLLPDLSHGDVVGIYMQNGLDWIEVFWCILHAGFCPLLMNLRLGTNVLESALADLGAKAVVSDSVSFSVPTIISSDIVADADVCTNTDFGTHLYIMSSGTSSSVKLCAYGADQIFAQIQSTSAIFSQSKQIGKMYDGNIKLLTFLPFYHIFGFVAVYVWFAFFSRTMVHLDNYSPQTIINTIRRHRVTHIFAVPLFWNKVYDQAIATVKKRGDAVFAKLNRALAIADWLSFAPWLCRVFKRLAFREVRDNLFGDSVQFMITGGSEIKTNVISFFNNIGYHFANGYGMSEIGITSVELSNSPRILNSGSIGAAFSSVSYKLNSDSELLVKGGTLSQYIIVDGKRVDNDGWFNTHDIAQCKDGRYYILGRQDDLVISANGENLNPNIIEPMLDSIAGVRGVCLVGARVDGDINPVLIVSVAKYISMDKLATIKQDLATTMAHNGVDGLVSRVVFTRDSLILDDEIKLNRRRIASDYASGKYTPVDFDTAVDFDYNTEICTKVVAMFADALGVAADCITADYDFFADGGGTSLDYFAFITQLTDEYGIDLPANDSRSLSSVAEISKFIEDKLTND